ncbi:MAG TPA: helix-turn-helix transcriptional regulator [Clostridium sp.]|uniref:helix-turn-helix domain-containing protein n=1 Tax=Clostridium sp. TaxID=1506 RepID=UPI002F936EFE
MTVLTHNEWCQINSIITKVYSCKNIITLRGDLLAEIRKLVPYQKAFFDLGDNKGSNNIFFDPIAVDMSDTNLDNYYTHFEPLDYALWVLSQNSAIIYRDTDLIPNGLREKSLFCNEWLKPMDVFYCGGTSIVENGTLFGSITLMRSKNTGDFSDHDLEVCSILNSHLCRCFRQTFPNGISYKSSTLIENDIMNKYRLTQREYEILPMLNAGMHNSEISSKLFISENTTKKHVAHIFEKLNVSSRSQLVRVVCEQKNIK